MATIDYRSPNDGRTLFIVATPDTRHLIESGQYHAWDCLNEQFGPVSLNVTPHLTTIRLAHTFNLAPIADLYAKLPGIISAEPEVSVGDRSTIYVSRDRKWSYIFDFASGDCIVGCTHHVLHYFRTDADGNVEKVGVWSSDTVEQPEWVPRLWRKYN